MGRPKLRIPGLGNVWEKSFKPNNHEHYLVVWIKQVGGGWFNTTHSLPAHYSTIDKRQSEV